MTHDTEQVATPAQSAAQPAGTAIADSAAVRVELAARPENVAVMRQVLAGIGEALELDPAVLADMKVAVTEACTNVVVHAYAGGNGAIVLEAAPGEQAMTVTVRDHGRGIGTREPDQQGLGLGLPLIASLSDTFSIAGGAERGTEVRMTFAFERDDDGS
jgi:serine/threonine-protein kinase RsbW